MEQNVMLEVAFEQPGVVFFKSEAYNEFIDSGVRVYIAQSKENKDDREYVIYGKAGWPVYSSLDIDVIRARASEEAERTTYHKELAEVKAASSFY